MSLDDLPNLIILSPSLNKNPWVDIRVMGLFIQHCILFNELPRCMINVLLPFQSLHPNKIALLEPNLNSRLPVIISPALDTFKASRSSTYFSRSSPCTICTHLRQAETCLCSGWPLNLEWPPFVDPLTP